MLAILKTVAIFCTSLALFKYSSIVQNGGTIHKIKLPVYLVFENIQGRDSITGLFSKLLKEKGVKVIDEAEWKRLTRLLNEKMFKEVNESKKRGFDADIKKITQKLPEYYQILTFSYLLDTEQENWQFSQANVNIMIMAMKVPSKNITLADTGLAGKSIPTAALVMLEAILPQLK